MKRTFILLITFPFVFLLVLGIATDKETWSEMNHATGAMRTRSTRALVFDKPWVETSTWVSERAAQLGIDTDSEWQILSYRREYLGIVTRGCGRTPASFQLRFTDESELSQEEQDAFVRNFVKADDPARKTMIRELADATP